MIKRHSSYSAHFNYSCGFRNK